MANDIMNRITFNGDPEKIKTLLSQLHGENGFDFNRLIPMPKELDITSPSPWEIYIEHHRDSEDMIERLPLQYKDEYKKAKRNHTPSEKDLIYGERAYNNILDYGHPTWYEWCTEKWGTKWNAYECSINLNIVQFCTAWSIPRPIIQKMHEIFPDMDFIWEFADEDRGYNVGRFKIFRGKLMLYLPKEGSSEACKMHDDIWGR